MLNKQQTLHQTPRSLKPVSRGIQKPEVQLNPNFKSLTNIPQTSRATEKQFQIKHSINDIVTDALQKRSNYHSIIFDKKYSLQNKSEHYQDVIEKLKEIKLGNQEKSQPKGILKSKISQSKEPQRNDVPESNDPNDKTLSISLRQKFSSLRPLKSTKAQVSPTIFEVQSAKRVQFNKEVFVKLIEENKFCQPKRYVLADLNENI